MLQTFCIKHVATTMLHQKSAYKHVAASMLQQICCIDLIKHIARCVCNMWRLTGDYGLHNRPTSQTIGKIVKKFEELGVVAYIEIPVHHRFPENISVAIERRYQELELSYGTLWRILHLDLHLHPY